MHFVVVTQPPYYGGEYRMATKNAASVKVAPLADRVVVTLFSIPEAIEYDQQHRGYIHDF